MPKRMFFGTARMLNIICNEIDDYNFYEKKVHRKLILKKPYVGEPGQN